MNNTVSPGYKQTEVGMIPEDWELKTLQDVCRVPITYGIVQCGPHVSNGVPYIRVTDMDQRNLDVSGMMRTEPAIAAQFSRSIVQSGDIVYALRGLLGEVHLVSNEVAGANLTQGTARLAPKDTLASGYLIWAMRCMTSIQQAELQAKGSTFREITLADLRQINVLIPPFLEQRAIATALSDVDALIASLDRLIAKKRDMKQAAMQELLTGKRRLPGFDNVGAYGYTPNNRGECTSVKSGECHSPLHDVPHGWEVKRLGEICEKVTTGKLDANAMVPDGDYPFFTCARERYAIDTYAFDTEALLVSGNGANVGYIHYYHGKFNAYQRTYVLTGFSADIQFVKLFMERNLQDRLRTEVNAGNTPYIVMGTLTDMVVTLPKNLAEQTAIATILSDMDTEIAALEQKRDKTRLLKQGMMQELLTGKIRLNRDKLSEP